MVVSNHEPKLKASRTQIPMLKWSKISKAILTRFNMELRGAESIKNSSTAYFWIWMNDGFQISHKVDLLSLHLVGQQLFLLICWFLLDGDYSMDSTLSMTLEQK